MAAAKMKPAPRTPAVTGTAAMTIIGMQQTIIQ
jgi:hypothetical protein